MAAKFRENGTGKAALSPELVQELLGRFGDSTPPLCSMCGIFTPENVLLLKTRSEMSTASVSCFLVLFCALPGFAQQYALGFLAGYASQKGMSVESAGVPVSAGFLSANAVNVFAGRYWSRWGVEWGYTHRFGFAEVGASPYFATLQARQHIFTGNAIYHFRQRDSTLRPFVVFGAGSRFILPNGPVEGSAQTGQYPVLNDVNEVLPVFHFGGGVELRLFRRPPIRLQFSDYMSPRPAGLISPVPGARVKGWMHDLIPSFGLVCIF
jgi:hypothetical protein